MESKVKKIFIAGHLGMVGSAILRQLQKDIDVDLILKGRSELDLTDQNEVNLFLKDNKPDQIYMAAAKVGGIQANNNYPADFLFQNLSMELNLINGAFINGVKKILFLGSSCIYPRLAPQPIKEKSLLTDSLEPTNEAYAIAKIAGIKLCESYNRQYGETAFIDYRSVMPTNIYGSGDNYHLENSHVIPGLIHRFHLAKEQKKEVLEVWGTGRPFREFLHVDDLAAACIHLMKLNKQVYDSLVEPTVSQLNVGSGKDLTIKELSMLISEVVGFKGRIQFDDSKPDGTPRKLLDSSKFLSSGWSPKIELFEGLTRTYEDFLMNKSDLRLK